MTATGLEAFDTTVQKSNRWLNELMELTGWKDKHRAYRALRSTLHALRDRLPVDEVAQFSAQLPMLIRGLYFEGWDPSDKPLKLRHKEQFLARISEEFATPDDPGNPEEIARAVFTLLSRRITDGEIDDVKHVMPSDLWDLWPTEHLVAK